MNKKSRAKIEKFKGELDRKSYSGEKIVDLFEREGYMEFLLKSSSVTIDKLEDCLLVKADLVYFVIDEVEGSYRLNIE
jgi:hypothetical protein